MKSRIYLILILLFSITIYCKAENYEKYYELINRAEEKFVLKKDRSCFIEYDIAFKRNKPFLKDPFIASQIAIYLGDTLKFYEYLKICFQNGMPITSVNASPIIKEINKNEIGRTILMLFDKFYNDKIIDVNTKDKICLMCYQSDSFKVKIGGRSIEFYKNEDETRKYILDSFLVFGKFPNEQLLGITTDKTYTYFYEKFGRKSVYEDIIYQKQKDYFEEFELRLKCPYNIILHSRCFYTEYKELFFKAMQNGFIHPKEIGILEETAIIWHQNHNNPTEKCKKVEYKICYNIFGKEPGLTFQIFDNTENGLKIIEENRKKIFMQKYSVDQQKKAIEKETGIKFFFDFADR